MRTYAITILLGATIGLGMLLGCATEIPTSISVTQTLDPPNSGSVNKLLSDAVPVEAKSKSLITLGDDQDLAKLVREAPGVVLIDFHASWCGPCVKQGKVLRELEGFASKRKASIIKVDVDQHKNLAEIFDVSALPTLMLVKDGKIVDRQLGLANRTRITELLKR